MPRPSGRVLRVQSPVHAGPQEPPPSYDAAVAMPSSPPPEPLPPPLPQLQPPLDEGEKIECPTCMEDFAPAAMYTIGCKDKHVSCHTCEKF